MNMLSERAERVLLKTAGRCSDARRRMEIIASLPLDAGGTLAAYAAAHAEAVTANRRNARVWAFIDRKMAEAFAE